MNHPFSIKTSPDQHSELAIHPDSAAALGLGDKKFAHLCFGNRKQHVNIKLNRDISPAAVRLSQNLIGQLHLPEYPLYELRLNQNAVIIGPYIGLLVSTEDHRLTSSRFTKMMVCLKEYAGLHGAVVMFALNKVDRENRLIEGYCYHPVKKCWQKGIFPYPAAIYRTIGLNAAWKNHFLTEIGDKIFNSRFFNKWEMYQWFSKDPAISSHIPATVLYHSPQDVFDMLAKYPEVYAKPTLGLRGRGIVRILTENNLIQFKYRESKENRDVSFTAAGQAGEYMQQRFRPGRYLIQQAVNLLEYQDGIIDFRCVVQKNQAGAWICRAIIGRSGVKDSIVSNISSGGSAFPAELILKKSGAKNSAELKAAMTALAITVCNQLDEYGINCGTLGLDIGIDRQGRLWLIEINNRDPDPSIALDIHDTSLYYDLKTGPLFYAKFLAGFKAMNDSQNDESGGERLGAGRTPGTT